MYLFHYEILLSLTGTEVALSECFSHFLLTTMLSNILSRLQSQETLIQSDIAICKSRLSLHFLVFLGKFHF